MVSVLNGNSAPRYGNKLTPEQYAEAVKAGSEVFNAGGSAATSREVLASISSAKSSDAEVQAFNKMSLLHAVNSVPEQAPPASEAEYAERFWAAHAKAAALGCDLRYEPRTGTVGIYYPGGIRDTSSALPAIERELALRTLRVQQAKQYADMVQAQTDRTNDAIRQAAERREFAESGHDVVSQLRTELAGVKAELAALRNAQPAPALVAPEMPPVEYALGAADDEPADEAGQGVFNSVKTTLSDLVSRYQDVR